MDKSKILMRMIRETEGTYQHGFDHTDISAGDWKKVLNRAGVTEMEPEHESEHGSKFWVWESPKIKIVTLNNPISGEYAGPGKRENEKDFAGYIGLEGDEDTVEIIANLIKSLASDIKGESPGDRSYI